MVNRKWVNHGFWHCYHIEVCATCGKHLRDNWYWRWGIDAQPNFPCPDFKPSK